MPCRHSPEAHPLQCEVRRGPRPAARAQPAMGCRCEAAAAAACDGMQMQRVWRRGRPVQRGNATSLRDTGLTLCWESTTRHRTIPSDCSITRSHAFCKSTMQPSPLASRHWAAVAQPALGRRHWATVGAAALGCAVFRHSAAGATRWAAVGLHGDRAQNRNGVSVCVRARARACVCVCACVGNCVAFRAGRAFFNAHRALC